MNRRSLLALFGLGPAAVSVLPTTSLAIPMPAVARPRNSSVGEWYGIINGKIHYPPGVQSHTICPDDILYSSHDTPSEARDRLERWQRRRGIFGFQDGTGI